MLKQTLLSIEALHKEAMERCQRRLDNLTKPLNSLHHFEQLALQMAGITGIARPRSLSKTLILMAGDHGIAAETAVCGQPMLSTGQRVENICNQNSAVNIFAEHVQAKLVLVDIGVAEDIPCSFQFKCEKIAYGTKNILQEAAMSREEAVKAVELGIKIAKEEVAKGAKVIGIGEVSFANRISAAAIVACYTGKKPGELYPVSAQDTKEREKKLLEKVLAVHSPNLEDAMDVLRKLGGLEIAGLVGIILGAASARAVVVLDGLATSAAAILAVQLNSQVKDYLVGSHYSKEPAHQEAIDYLGVPAYLHLEMDLGEGTGAALGMSLLNASLHVLNDMKTFGEAQVAVAQDGPGALRQSHDVRE